MRYGLKLLLACLVTVPLSLTVVCCGLLDRSGKVAYRVSRLWTWTILKIGRIRLKVEGLEHLDPRRQYIFMANHQSNIDIPVLVQSLEKFQLRWVAKKELLYVPFFGWALWASQHIIVDRANRAKAAASLRKAKETIKGEICLVFFPEGTRSLSGKLLPFKRGGFVLALKTQTPIVPITINGSGSILPRGDWRIRGGEIEVIVSEPILLDQHQRVDIGSLLAHVREIMESHARSREATHGLRAVALMKSWRHKAGYSWSH